MSSQTVPMVGLYHLGSGEHTHALMPGQTLQMRCGAWIQDSIDRFPVRTGQPSCQNCYRSLARDAASVVAQ